MGSAARLPHTLPMYHVLPVLDVYDIIKILGGVKRDQNGIAHLAEDGGIEKLFLYCGVVVSDVDFL